MQNEEGVEYVKFEDSYFRGYQFSNMDLNGLYLVKLIHVVYFP